MLLDTSGLLAYFDRAAQQHAATVALVDEALTLLTTSYVLCEFVSLCHSRGAGRRASFEFHADLLDSPDLEIVWVEEPLHVGALSLLRQRMDKSYSLCDAVSFLLMRERGITDALTTDRHFEQEGFVRLLKP
jgi:predicted nucleic acid-binding protein